MGKQVTTTKGYRHINNGIEQRSLKPGEVIPQGWSFGSLPRIVFDGKNSIERSRQRINDQQKRWRKENKEKTREYSRQQRLRNPEKEVHWQLMKNYGITLEQYNVILEAQDHKCAICGTDDPGSKRQKRFFVDHDHDTGKVRGLLCIMCNMSIGGFKDNVDIINKAIDYIEHYRDNQIIDWRNVKETAGNTQWL